MFLCKQSKVADYYLRKAGVVGGLLSQHWEDREVRDHRLGPSCSTYQISESIQASLGYRARPTKTNQNKTPTLKNQSANQLIKRSGQQKGNLTTINFTNTTCLLQGFSSQHKPTKQVGSHCSSRHLLSNAG